MLYCYLVEGLTPAMYLIIAGKITRNNSEESSAGTDGNIKLQKRLELLDHHPIDLMYLMSASTTKNTTFSPFSNIFNDLNSAAQLKKLQKELFARHAVRLQPVRKACGSWSSQ